MPPPTPSSSDRVLVHQHCWSRGTGPGPTAEFPSSRWFELGVGDWTLQAGDKRGPSGWDGLDASSLYFDPSVVSVTATNAAGQTLDLSGDSAHCLADFTPLAPFDNQIRRLTIAPRAASSPVYSTIGTPATLVSSAPAAAPPQPYYSAATVVVAPSGVVPSAPAAGGGTMLAAVVVCCCCVVLLAVGVAAMMSGGAGNAGSGDGGDAGQ